MQVNKSEVLDLFNEKRSRNHEILCLSLEDVIDCGGGDIKKAAVDLEQGFKLLAQKKINQPFKTTLKSKLMGDSCTEGLVNFLPAYVVNDMQEEIYGCKALGAMPPNVDVGLPRATGIIVLFNSENKCPICVMDAQVISATRTGAVTAIASKRLADMDTEEIGMVGAGVNMRTQLLGLHHSLPNLKKVSVYSRFQSKYDFAEKMGKRTGLEIIPVQSAEEAVKDKDLIVTCLPNILSPVVKDKWVKTRGITHINIGCYESEATILGRMDRVVADLWEQGKHRGVQTHAQAVKQGVISEDKIEDLAPIINDEVQGRVRKDENIFFAPTGLGFEDMLVAWRVYQEAKYKGVGSPFSLWNSSQWI